VTFGTGSTDTRGQIIVTTSAGGTMSANPTLTFTFKDGTFTTAPFATIAYDSTSSGPTATPGLAPLPPSVTTTATTMVITYQGTPTTATAKTYKFNYIVLK
jgi:hypothetical protein